MNNGHRHKSQLQQRCNLLLSFQEGTREALPNPPHSNLRQATSLAHFCPNHLNQAQKVWQEGPPCTSGLWLQLGTTARWRTRRSGRCDTDFLISSQMTASSHWAHVTDMRGSGDTGGKDLLPATFASVTGLLKGCSGGKYTWRVGKTSKS